MTLVERYGCFGGNITAVGVEGFAWYRHEKTIDSDGIGREFEERAKSDVESWHPNHIAPKGWRAEPGINLAPQAMH